MKTAYLALTLALSLSIAGGLALAQDSSGDAPAKASAPKAKRAKREAAAGTGNAGDAKADTASAASPAAPQAQVAPQAQAAPQAARVCTLDRSAVLGTAAINVASAQRFGELRQAAQGEIVEATRAADNEGRALDADRRPPTDEGLKRARDGLAERRRTIASRAALLSRELDVTLQSVNSQIGTAAGPVLQAVEKAQGCSILLARESVIDGPGTVDVTQAVVQQMDAQLRPRPFDLVQIETPKQP